MSTAIAINQQQIALKTYQGKAVVTFSDIDAVHQRPEGTARRNFNTNKTRFVLGEDYFKVCANEIRTHKIMEISDKAREDYTFITESGYLMLCKSFTDDLSWQVQRQLVDCYFHHTEREQEPYEYFDKTYRGVPVLTTRDFEHFTGVPKSSVNPLLRNHAEPGKDYFQINSFQDRLAYKKENPRIKQVCGVLNLITRSGVEMLCGAFGIQFDPPEGLVAVETPPDPADEDRAIVEKSKKYIMLLDNLLAQFETGGDNIERGAYKKLMYLTVSDLMTYISYLGGKAGQIDIDNENKKFYYRLEESDKHYIFGVLKGLLREAKYCA